MKIKKLDIKQYKDYQKVYPMSDLCAKVLASKNIPVDTLDELLFSKQTTDDFSLSFLDDVIHRLEKAKENNEKIIVCGDYDCDGICATTILVDALRKFGIECGYYIPNRFSEGYGLNCHTVTKAIEKGYQIIITVDNGVKAKEALQLAKDNQIEIILSDHHQYEESDLICDYFLHPNVFPSFYQNMSGAGVAFLLSKRLIGNYFKHTILGCVATIGDIVPLLNANRVLVKEGINLLNGRNYMALQLLQNDTKRWDAKKIAFQVVPKINCVGRLADEANANTMVSYLLLENDNMIQNTLYQINELNEKRKSIGAEMEDKALSLLTEDDFSIVYDESFHEGLNGIVASKLVSTTQKPAMVLSKKDDILKGSIRSNGVDLSTFFDGIQKSLIAYGGHKEAAGIAFAYHDLDKVKTYVQTKMKTIHLEQEIACIALQQKEISFEDVEGLSLLEPMGCGFELPLFLVEDTPLSMQQMSNGKHLKYQGEKVNYLYFNQGARYHQDQQRDTFTFVGQLEINYFWNKKSLSMIVDRIIDTTI